MDRSDLLPDIGITHSARLCDSASGDSNARSGFSPQMGPAQENRALDHPDLALCIRHGRVCVLDALQIVSARSVTSNLALNR